MKNYPSKLFHIESELSPVPQLLKIYPILRRVTKDRQHNGHKKKDKQRSTKHTQKTKDRVTRTPLKTEGEFRCFILFFFLFE